MGSLLIAKFYLAAPEDPVAFGYGSRWPRCPWQASELCVFPISVLMGHAFFSFLL